MIRCNNSCPEEKFEGCCHCCPENEGCEIKCVTPAVECKNAIFDEESGLIAFEKQEMEVIQQIADICTQKKALEAAEKELKDNLKAAMEMFNIKSVDNDILKITYIAATTATSVDSTKLKKQYPAIAEECSKVSPKSAYIKVEVKS